MLGVADEADDAVQEAWRRASREHQCRRQRDGMADHDRGCVAPRPRCAHAGAGAKTPPTWPSSKGSSPNDDATNPRAKPVSVIPSGLALPWSSTRSDPRSASPSCSMTCSPCHSTKSPPRSSSLLDRPPKLASRAAVECSAPPPLPPPIPSDSGRSWRPSSPDHERAIRCAYRQGFLSTRAASRRCRAARRCRRRGAWRSPRRRRDAHQLRSGRVLPAPLS